MIQIVDKPNTTPIYWLRQGNFDLQSFASFKCSCSRSSGAGIDLKYSVRLKLLAQLVHIRECKTFCCFEQTVLYNIVVCTLVTDRKCLVSIGYNS